MSIKNNAKKLAFSTLNATAPANISINGNYQIPSPNTIPNGKYFSRIVKVRSATSKSGSRATEVLYELKRIVDCWDVVNGPLSQEIPFKTYLIKEVYTESTSNFGIFCDSIIKGLGIQRYADICIDNVEGLTEYVEISNYENEASSVISERSPLTWKNFVKFAKMTPKNLII